MSSPNVYKLFLAVTFATLILGIYGYMQDFGYSIDDAVYKTITLFTLNDSDLPQNSIYINISRFLAPIALALGGVQAVYYLSKNSVERFFRIFLHRHIIICGFGVTGETIYKELLRKRRSHCFVLIDYDRQPIISDYRTLFIKGDAASEEILKRARIVKAKEIYIVTGDDIQNLIIFEKIRRLKLAGEARIIIRMEREEWKEYLQANPNKDGSSNTEQRMILDMKRIVLSKIMIPNTGQRLAILGCGSVGQLLILRYEQTHRITVFEQSSRIRQIFRSRYPQAIFQSYTCDVNLIERNEIKEEDRNPDIIFICLGGDRAGLAASLHWRKMCPDAEIHLFVAHMIDSDWESDFDQSFLTQARIIVHPIIEQAIHGLSENKHYNSGV